MVLGPMHASTRITMAVAVLYHHIWVPGPCGRHKKYTSRNKAKFEIVHVVHVGTKALHFHGRTMLGPCEVGGTPPKLLKLVRPFDGSCDSVRFSVAGPASVWRILAWRRGVSRLGKQLGQSQVVGAWDVWKLLYLGWPAEETLGPLLKYGALSDSAGVCSMGPCLVSYLLDLDVIGLFEFGSR